MDYHAPHNIKQFEILQIVQDRGIDVASYIFNLPKSEVKNLVNADIHRYTSIVSYHENIVGSLKKRLQEAEVDDQSRCWICGTDDGHKPRNCKEVCFIPSCMMNYHVCTAIGEFEIIQTVHHRGINLASRIFNSAISEVKKIVLKEINYHADIVKSHKKTLEILNNRLQEKDRYVRFDCLIHASEYLEEPEKEEKEDVPYDEDTQSDMDHQEIRLFIPFRGVPCYKCGMVGHYGSVCNQVWSPRA